MSVTINLMHVINRVSRFLDSIYTSSPFSPIFERIVTIINDLFVIKEMTRRANSQLGSLSSLPSKEDPIVLSLSAPSEISLVPMALPRKHLPKAPSEISPAPTAHPRKHSPTSSPEAASNPGKAPTAPPRKRQPQNPPVPPRKRSLATPLLSEAPPIKASVVEKIADPTPQPTTVFPSEPPKKIGIVLRDGPDDKDSELEGMFEFLKKSEEKKRADALYGEVFTPVRREITIPFFKTPPTTLSQSDLGG